MPNNLGNSLNTTLATGVAAASVASAEAATSSRASDQALPCYMVNNLARNTDEQCKFVLDNDCLEEEAALDYVHLVFCQIDYELRVLAISLVIFFVIVLFLNLSAVADEFLCPSLLTVAKNLRMSDSLAGVTLLAFGNGCPDIFASLAAASSGRPELIVGELLGAGIFCSSIVAGLIFISADFKIARRPLLRDTSFYLLSVYLIWLFCSQGVVTFYGALAFIVIYVIYLLVALAGQAIHSRLRGEYPIAETSQGDESTTTTTTETISSEWPERTEKELIYRGLEELIRRRSSGVLDGKAVLDICNKRELRTEKEVNATTPQVKTVATIQLASPAAMADTKNGSSSNSFNEVNRETEICTTKSDRNKDELIQIVNHLNCDSNPKGEKSNQNPRAVYCAAEPNVVVANNHEKGNELTGKQPKESTYKSACATQSSSVVLDKIEGLVWIDQQPNDGRQTAADATRFNLDELDHFLCQINPIDKINWSQSSLLIKLMCLLRAPLLLLSILTIPVVDLEKAQSNWCRLLNSIHCFTVPIAAVALTSLKWGSEPWWWFSSSDYDRRFDVISRGNDPIPKTNLTGQNRAQVLDESGGHRNLLEVAAGDDDEPLRSCLKFLVFLPGLMLAIYVFNTTSATRPPKYHPIYAYFGFIMSVIWIYKLANEIISLLKTVGIIFSMSDTAIGLGFLAWGNSLGDIVANLTLAQAGYARMALGASIGAPLLNLLLGFGLSFTFSLEPGDSVAIDYNDTMSLLAGTLALILILLMASTLFASNRSKKPLGYLLIICYAFYFMLAVCLEYDLI